MFDELWFALLVAGVGFGATLALAVWSAVELARSFIEEHREQRR